MIIFQKLHTAITKKLDAITILHVISSCVQFCFNIHKTDKNMPFSTRQTDNVTVRVQVSYRPFRILPTHIAVIFGKQ